MEDPVLRNLRITQAYHELGRALDEPLSGEGNWCLFATWASKQAGQTIRAEDLAAAFERISGESSRLSRTLQQIVDKLRRWRDHEPMNVAALVKSELGPAAKLDRASAAITRGNLLVFEEIGVHFARFIEELAGDDAFDGARLASFQDGLRPGEPPDGQGHLRSAFESFYRALFETDPKIRAERVLAGNLRVGLHEQIRLQPEIAAALDAPVADLPALRRGILARILDPWGLRMAPLYNLYLRLTGRSIEPLWRRVTALLREKAHTVLTELAISLELPGRTLRLGRDFPASYPEALREIADPDLAALLDRLDPESGSAAGSGADDWADLDQRMHYVAEFFRSTQHDRALFAPPFEPSQLAALAAGKLPDRPL